MLIAYRILTVPVVNDGRQLLSQGPSATAHQKSQSKRVRRQNAHPSVSTPSITISIPDHDQQEDRSPPLCAGCSALNHRKIGIAATRACARQPCVLCPFLYLALSFSAMYEKPEEADRTKTKRKTDGVFLLQLRSTLRVGTW